MPDRVWRLLRAAISLAGVATLIVVAILAMRWSGARTPTTMFLPLKPLSADEAALLVSEATADNDAQIMTAITALTENEVTIVTRYAVFPVERQAAEAIRTVSFRDRTYTIHSATWGPYFSRYVLPRGALEVALGRPLTIEDVKPDVFNGLSISFESNALLSYVITEILALSAIFMVMLGLWMFTRQWWATLLGLAGSLFVVALWLPTYVPPLWDADEFYHRIALEFVGSWGAIFLAPVAAVVGITGALISFLSRVQPKPGKPPIAPQDGHGDGQNSQPDPALLADS